MEIENHLKRYFELCHLLDQLNTEKERIRADIQTELALNNLERFDSELGVVRFVKRVAEAVNKEKLRELVAEPILAQIMDRKELKVFEIRSREAIEKRQGGK